jgi:glucose/arabinose dehydrogenase
LLVTGAGDGSGRLFVVEQSGRIRIIKGSTLLPTPFLDLRSKVSCCGERGLLGLAFHPNFKSNRKFYVYYTNKSGTLTISQFSASASNPDRAITTERFILRIAHSRYANHNGGQLAFGPDGFLYIGTGDGGGSGDSLRSGQSRATLLGKILRININGTGGGHNYLVPSTNPYRTSTTAKHEIWSYGLRNPWRFSFDRATGDLWIGDVGQNRYEEIDRARHATGGGRAVNYGWRVMEGLACYAPSTGCSTSGKTRPIAVYSHSVGCAVTGGYVYRGSAYPLLVGGYFFGDYCSGRIWSLVANGSSSQAEALMLDSAASISAFGESESGELYLADYAAGVIYQLTGVAP